jgi:hypothetical protein
LAKQYYGLSPVQPHHKYYERKKKKKKKKPALEIFSHPKFNIVLCSYFASPSNSLIENRTETHDLLKQGILLVMGTSLHIQKKHLVSSWQDSERFNSCKEESLES